MSRFFAASFILERPTMSYNYFDSPTKLFSDLYLTKFLDISAKPFFPCTVNKVINFL